MQRLLKERDGESSNLVRDLREMARWSGCMGLKAASSSFMGICCVFLVESLHPRPCRACETDSAEVSHVWPCRQQGKTAGSKEGKTCIFRSRSLLVTQAISIIIGFHHQPDDIHRAQLSLFLCLRRFACLHFERLSSRGSLLETH